MPPDGEPLGHIRLEVQHQSPGKARSRRHHHDGRQVPGPQKGDAQECHKEYQRCAKVTHQRQTSHAIGGEQHREDQVPLGKQPVQGGGPRQDKRQLHQLRRLEGNGAHRYPVLGSENALPHHNVEGQQRRRQSRRRPPQLHRQLQPPQQPHQHAVDAHAQGHRRQLLVQSARVPGSGDGKAHRGQQQRQGLQVKLPPVQPPADAVQRPSQAAQAEKARADGIDVLRSEARGKLPPQQQLDKRQQPQTAHGIGPLFRLPGVLGLLRREEEQLHPAQGDGVPGVQIGRLQRPLSVQQHPAAAVDGVDPPCPAVVPLQNGVCPGHGGKIHPDIRPPGPADDVLPVIQLVPRAVGQGHKAPALPVPAPEQGLAAPHQQPHRQPGGHTPEQPQDHRQRRGNILLQKCRHSLRSTSVRCLSRHVYHTIFVRKSNLV